MLVALSNGVEVKESVAPADSPVGCSKKPTLKTTQCSSMATLFTCCNKHLQSAPSHHRQHYLPAVAPPLKTAVQFDGTTTVLLHLLFSLLDNVDKPPSTLYFVGSTLRELEGHLYKKRGPNQSTRNRHQPYPLLSRTEMDEDLWTSVFFG